MRMTYTKYGRIQIHLALRLAQNSKSSQQTSSKDPYPDTFKALFLSSLFHTIAHNTMLCRTDPLPRIPGILMQISGQRCQVVQQLLLLNGLRMLAQNKSFVMCNRFPSMTEPCGFKSGNRGKTSLTLYFVCQYTVCIPTSALMVAYTLFHYYLLAKSAATLAYESYNHLSVRCNANLILY